MPTTMHLRQEYTKDSLNESDMHINPHQQFADWFNQAVEAQCMFSDAVTLATASKDGKPDARMVLLKSYNNQGFIFCTNLQSVKAQQLDQNPFASLLFFWPELERQIRIQGSVKKIDDTVADNFFAKRPRLSQIAACISKQSNVVASRQILEERFRKKLDEVGKNPIPRPYFWGGYELSAHTMEFWQGRENRLHDRLLYVKNGDSWNLQRLEP